MNATLLTWAILAAAPPDQEIVDRMVRDALTAWDVPGAAVVIVSADRVAYLQGHGVRQLGKPDPVTSDTVFPWASCSKAVTTALIAQLVGERKMAWDDPVRKYLSDFHLSEPLADGDVVLRDLLTHRTGVGAHDYLWYGSQLPQIEQVRRLRFLPLDHRFRTRFQYQSVMYTAAGLAAAKSGGDEWAKLVQNRLFGPLGMIGATCTTPLDLNSSASPHRTDRDGKLRVIDWYEQKEPNPAGSIHARLKDAANWLQFHLNSGKWQDKQLVDASALIETRTPQFALRMEGIPRKLHPETLLMSYGLGWVIQDYRGEQLCSHAGIIDGFRCQMTLIPRAGIAIGVFCNRHDSRMTMALTNNLVDALLALPTRDWNQYLKALTLAEQDETKRKRREFDQLKSKDGPPRPLADFVGTYEHPAYGRATVELEKDQLIWSWGVFRLPLSHHHGMTFEATDERLADGIVEFEVNNGKVVVLRMFGVEFVKK